MNKHQWCVSVFLVSLLLIVTVGIGSAQGPTLPPRGGRVPSSPRASALDTAFTYQGQLKESGNPVNATCDLRFGLWDSLSGGNQVGASPQTKTNVQIVNGLFTVELDFGNAFDGNAGWLEIEVRCPAGSGSYSLLTPRQVLNATPYALYAKAAPWGGLTGVPSGFADGIDDLTLPFSQTVTSDSNAFTIINTGTGRAVRFEIDNTANTRPALSVWTNGTGSAGQFGINNAANTKPALSVSTNGSGNALDAFTSGNGYAISAGTSGNGWAALSATNDGTGMAGVFSIDNAANTSAALQVKAGHSGTAFHAHIYNTANNQPAVQGSTKGIGSAGSFYIDNAFNSSPAFDVHTNGIGSAGDFYINNINNSVSALNVSTNGTGGAGNFNINNATNSSSALSAHTNGSGASIDARTSGTGWTGYFTTNSGKGIYISTGNEDGLYVDGGVRFDVNNDRWVKIWDDGTAVITTSTGAYLATGGTWTNASDRSIKANFVSADTQEVLARVADLPIQTWNYKAENSSIRHMGPTAQDFYAVFGLGDNDKSISTVDADGVALAAIQGLNQKLLEKDKEIAAQQQQIAAIQARLSALEQTTSTTCTSSPILPGGWAMLGGLLVAAVMIGQWWLQRGAR